jgi:hypothetical protein
MPDKEQWGALIERLVELTEQKELTWEGPEDSAADTGRQYREYFAKYQDKFLRVRKASGSFTSVTATGPVTSPGRERYYLGILDSNKKLLYSGPEVPGIDNLFETIQFQIAGLQEMFDDLLKPKQKG